MVGKKNGTIDEYPQLLHLNLAAMATINTYLEAVTNTPVVIGAETHWVMEILKIFFMTPTAMDAAGSNIVSHLSSRTKTSIATLNDPDVIAVYDITFQGTYAQGAGSEQRLAEVDLQGANGKGLLFAGKQLFLAISSSGLSTLKPTVACMILYRLVEVKAEELIGLATQAYN